jgi:hypothetical protein
MKMLLVPPPPKGCSVAASRGGPSAPGAAGASQNVLIEAGAPGDEFLEALLERRDNGPERKLMRLVEFDEIRTVTILKQWVRQGANG